LADGKAGEELFFNLAIQDLGRAADLFRPVYERTATVDGFVSLEVSPLFAYDTKATIDQAKLLHAQAQKPNLFIKIPGTKEGLPAIEKSIFAGIPINVTLLSVASLFVSRWDVAVADKVPASLRNTLGVAVSKQVYQAYRDILGSDRFQRLENAGARPQRLLFASTGTKDKTAPDTLYIGALAAPNTVNTMPEATLLTMARRRHQFRGMAARQRCSPRMPKPGLICRRSPRSCNPTGRKIL
jgi:transaldolase